MWCFNQWVNNMQLSNVAYKFSDKAVAQRLMSKNLDLVPYGGQAFVITCGNGSYFVIVVRDKKNQHVGFISF
jgi:uncharacterized protein YuzB (UPF0349 family)